MSLKNKYLIDDDNWKKVSRFYKIAFLIGTPYLALCFCFMAWPIITNLSWSPVILIPWIVFYVPCIFFAPRFMVRSKYSLFMSFYMISLVELYFLILSSAICFRFFGIKGLIIQETLLLITFIGFSIHYYPYWNLVWDSNKKHNENIALDLENGRYDYLNMFDLDERKVEKKHKEKMSNPAIVRLVAWILPISPAATLIYIKHHSYTVPLAFCWILLFFFILGVLKSIIASFVTFKKVCFYEKKIGKPIINGLLK